MAVLRGQYGGRRCRAAIGSSTKTAWIAELNAPLAADGRGEGWEVTRRSTGLVQVPNAAGAQRNKLDTRAAFH
jgi:hypothetical protein